MNSNPSVAYALYIVSTSFSCSLGFSFVLSIYPLLHILPNLRYSFCLSFKCQTASPLIASTNQTLCFFPTLCIDPVFQDFVNCKAKSFPRTLLTMAKESIFVVVVMTPAPGKIDEVLSPSGPSFPNSEHLHPTTSFLPQLRHIPLLHMLKACDPVTNIPCIRQLENFAEEGAKHHESLPECLSWHASRSIDLAAFEKGWTDTAVEGELVITQE